MTKMLILGGRLLGFLMALVMFGQAQAQTNVALAGNGGVATASSTYSSNYPTAAAINGDRKGVGWAHGSGGWNDATVKTYPDWLQIAFTGSQTIGEIDVFTIQDSYATAAPTPTMTFTQNGITDFQVQYWDGTAWIDVPGGNVVGNNLVWRQFIFSPITTDKIRVVVNASAGKDGYYSRIAEVEAWTVSAGANIAPTVTLTAPSNGTSYTAPASISLAANATDTDGSIAKVEFYRGSTLIGTATGAPYSYTDANVAAGSYSYTAKAYDNLGAVTTTSAASITVSAAGGGSINVALSSNGGVATASSTYSAKYPVTAAINGDRKGLNWGNGGGWNDATAGTYPDWLQVTFSTAQTIGEIDVFTIQDYYRVADPTLSMTFSQHGITSFQVQYWNGSAWTDVPGGNVTGNNYVWRKFTFTPITTDRIRVVVNAGATVDGNYSRIAEIEAWTATGGTTNIPPTANLTAPSNGASYTAPASISLAATAADTDGSIAKVEFYRGSTLIGTATGAPYSYTDTNVAAGSYSYTAKAYDNLGAVTTSAAAGITVSGATPQPLSVGLSGAGSGTVVSSPAGIDCGSTCSATFAGGSVVTLTATPTGSASFAGWVGACTGNSPTCSVTLNQAAAVDAAFAVPTATTYYYDANGNLTQVTDPLGRIRKTSYDALDRPYLVQEPSPTTVGATQGQITTAYDGQDQTATITDPRNLQTSYSVDGLGNLTSLTSPDTGTTTATYDEAGNLKTRTDARGITVSYQYDALNRLTQIAYGDQTVTLTWDSCANGVGRLCRITDGSGSTTYTYDDHGRVLTKTQTIGSAVLTVRYDYTDGRLTRLTLPSGKAVEYGWTEGQISRIGVDGTDQLSAIAWQPFGPVSGWTWGNGQATVRQFDRAGRLKSTTLGNNAAGAVDTRGLAYDAAGRITALVDGLDATLNQGYAYDGLDRLTWSRLQAAGLTTYSYAYDLSGNRTNRTLNGTTTTYATAATSNRLMNLTGGQSAAYSYDAAGNITSDGTRAFGYDNAGRRVWAKWGSVTTTFAYNALGQRVKKAGTTTTLYAYDEQGQLLGEYDAAGHPIEETVWLRDIPVLTIQGGAVYYVHTDHLNTPRRITRPNDNKPVWMWEAEPFGNGLPDQNPAGLGNFVYNLRMPGQVYDQETGQFYNYFRDYDPGTGRYGESDPIGLAGGINTYSYVGGNPLTRADPEGLQVPQALGCAAGSWAGPIGCGVGAGLVTVVGGALLMNTVGADDPKTKEKEETCPPEQPCDPPAGTMCSDFHMNSTPHTTRDIDGNHLGKLPDHVHIWQMNKSPKGCIWNRAGATNYTPINARPCSTYSSWVAQHGR